MLLLPAGAAARRRRRAALLTTRRACAARPAPTHPQSVSALLWDLARLWFHERHEVEGPELSPRLLEGWMANFTQVVRYAREAFPEVRRGVARCGSGRAASVDGAPVGRACSAQ